ncbi:MAG: DUF2877 domain-containing protein, partial [Candidatus Cloacimonadota bacterium]|nr:DUF2877 domain-containing protein [Candidatus Cloacimonadota bacterium]
EIISLVNNKIGLGPNNILISNFPNNAEQTINIENAKLFIGNTALKIDDTDIYKKIKIDIDNLEELQYIIYKLKENLNLKSKSLGFLINPEKKIHLESTFDKIFFHQVRRNVMDFSFNNLPNISKKMKGLGFGLTPSGDDFNSGILYGLNLLNTIEGIELSKLIDDCYQNSLGKNLISNTFLKFAYLNEYYDNFYNLMLSLKSKNSKTISYYRNRVIDSGHTSGSDMLTGFILTLKGGLND